MNAYMQLHRVEKLCICPLSGKKCDPPANVTNGSYTPLDPLGNYETGYSIIYSCNYGYNMSGESALTCIDSEVWNTSEPVCNRK